MAPKPQNLEIFTRYLVNLARHGQCLPLNIITHATKATKLSPAVARACRKHLLATGQLIDKRNVAAIKIPKPDGSGQDTLFFNGDGLKRDMIAEVENKLRRIGYAPVCDARVVQTPNLTPRGTPTHLIVGTKVMKLLDAAALVKMRKPLKRFLKGL